MNVRKVLFLLALLGFTISVFLAHEYSKPKPVFCVTGTSSCDLVRHSEYSTLFGISLPYFGAVYFLFIMTYLYIRSIERYAKSPDKLLFGIILVGLLFETVYAYIQIFVIDAICFWCLSIELIILVMATVGGLSLMGELKDKSGDL